MSDALRRVHNAVDRFLDGRAITQELHFTADGGESRRPKTALQALESVRPFAHELDRQAQLKLIVSQHGVHADGASAHWEFFVDLPQRRARLAGEWALSWDEAADDYGLPRIEITIRPFPPTDSPIRRLVASGKLLHEQMVGLWKQECSRLPSLPYRFRDTDAVVAEFGQQGLDLALDEFSLRTGLSPEGSICWIAETRDTTYYAALV